MKVFKRIFAIIIAVIILAAPVFATDDIPMPTVLAEPKPSAPIKLAIPSLAKPDLVKALKIAEKYYKLGIANATDHEKVHIPVIIDWKPDFTGKSQNPAKAAQYITSSAYLTAYSDLKGIYLPLNAALFALDSANATIAGNLASSIAAYSEDTAGKLLGESLTSGNEAKAYADDAKAVYEYALARMLEKPTIDISALPLLLNYGYLCIDMNNLDYAKVVLEAAYNLAPGHMPAVEGLAAYYLAKGDKEKAKKLLEDAKLPMMYRKMKTMQDNVDEEKVPQVKAEDSHETAISKLRNIDKLEIVLATDFYEELNPEGAREARKLVTELQNSIRFTAPDYNYLSQYSTLKNYRSQGGSSAYEAFCEELMALEEKVNSKREKNFDIEELELLLSQLESNPDMPPEQMLAIFNQSSIASNLSPESKILLLDPEDFVNPTDILAQQYNVLQYKHKWGSYTTYLSKQLNELLEAIVYANEDLVKKMIPLEESMRAELDKLSDEHDASHKKSVSNCDACIVKTHQIHSKYDPQLNNLAETGWMDITNFVSARYIQRIKPNLEAMYIECMKHVLLISDPAVRDKVEQNLKTDIEEFIVIAFQHVRQAYSINIRHYPYECNCNEAEVAAAAKRLQKEIDAAENQRIIMNMKAKQAFKAGEIPENSPLYKSLDKYSSSYQLLFMKMKMHPLKTEMKIEVGLPKSLFQKEGNKEGDKDAIAPEISGSFSITKNHINNTTKYAGGLTATIGADAKGAPISVSGSVTLKGEVTVDGNGNVVTGDVAGSIQGTASALGLEASATYEASVQRGCKLSGEVSHIIKNQAYNKLPDELKTFDPDKPEGRKKVLWQGEYQLSN